MAETTYEEVNKNPIKYCKLDPEIGSGSSGGGETTYIFCDFSGSMTDDSKNQFEKLAQSGLPVKVFVFGRKRVSYQSIKLGWIGWLETRGDNWVDASELWDKYNSYEANEWGTLPTFYPWGTYTDQIEVGISKLPANVPINVVFWGDGSFSDQNFITIMRRAAQISCDVEMGAASGRVDSLMGKLKHVTSFTFWAAHNTSDRTKTILDRELQQVLLTSRSTIRWNSIKLDNTPRCLARRLGEIKTCNVAVPDGWLMFDTGRNIQLYHEKLTPASIATILLKTPLLITDYISYLVNVFKRTPIIFTREDNMASSVFQALKILIHHKMDKFNIQKFLIEPLSVANTTPIHRQAHKMLRQGDRNSEKLFMEKMSSHFTGTYLKLVSSGTNKSPFTESELDVAMRDMSFSTFIAMMDRSFSESSTDEIITTRTDGFPLIGECDNFDELTGQSMKMFTHLLGDGRLISGNFQLIAAMYIMINEYITHPYLNRMAEAYVWNKTTADKIVELIYTDADLSGGLKFQDNIYSLTFSRVIYEFLQLYSDRLNEMVDIGVDIVPLKKIYRANCKIRLARSYKISRTVVKEDTYPFKVGSWFLVNPASWSDDVSDKFPEGRTCPYKEMPNIVVITDMPVRKERNFKKHCLRVRYLEGDDKDYTYVKPQYLTKLLDVEKVNALTDMSAHRTSDKNVRKFLRTMWFKWKHFADRIHDDDGKMRHGDGTLISFEDNMTTIREMIEGDGGMKCCEGGITVTKNLPLNREQIWTLLGFADSPVSLVGKVTREMIDWVMAMPDISSETILSMDGFDREISDESGIFRYDLIVGDIEETRDSFNHELDIKCRGYECNCGCEAILRPGVTYADPGCGHHYLPACLATYTKANHIQDPHNIKFGISKCPENCMSCLLDTVYFNDGTAIPLTSIANSIVNASGGNMIGRCDTCPDIFVRGPRDCAISHTLPTKCSKCLPKRFWQCPGMKPDGTQCSVMTEHGGGCRMFQCCPCSEGWDDPCDPGCEHTLYHGDNPIAIGCGYRYKMKDGLLQADGTALSDGSIYF